VYESMRILTRSDLSEVGSRHKGEERRRMLDRSGMASLAGVYVDTLEGVWRESVWPGSAHAGSCVVCVQGGGVWGIV
jgi:hypothetical protein